MLPMKWKRDGAEGAKVHIFATDLTVEGNPDKAVKYAIEKMGKIGTLVNNAGMGRFEMVPDIKDESYQEQFQLNVWACMAMVRSAVPHFIGKWWRVLLKL